MTTTLLLFLILVLVAYIAIKVGSEIAPVFRNSAVYLLKIPKGKEKVQIDILLPKVPYKSSLHIDYQVTAKGLVKTLKVDVLSNFDSLHSRKYLYGAGLEIVCRESSYVGASIASLLMRDQFAIVGSLFCSSQAFNLIIDELVNQKPILLRVYGPIIRKDKKDVEMMSSSFEILTENSRSGPDYFCEHFRDYISQADTDDTELLRSCVSKFDLNANRV